MSFKECKFCVMDESDRDISFDLDGRCNHCKGYYSKVDNELAGKDQNGLERIIASLKKTTGKYNCIIGVSGGVDSSYVALLAKDFGLNPLLVHLDNGWNSETAVKNVKNLANKTGFDLYTHVINWSEFKDVQRSLFKANVIDIELATDHAIKAINLKIAAKFNVKASLHGGNVTTEAIMPVSWRHTKIDKKNLLTIHKKFGTKKLKTFPTMGIFQYLYYTKIKKIRTIKLLSYVEFNRSEVVDRLKNELDWQEYGGKHHESVFTRFYQGYILPRKFNVDKRKCHLSNLICASQITREEALNELNSLPYNESLRKQDYEFVRKKLDFTEQEFEDYFNAPSVSHYAYPSDENLINKLLGIRSRLLSK